MIPRFSRPFGPYEDILEVYRPGTSFRSDMERVFPLVQQHDMQSADIRMAANLATETANVTGALLDIYLRTDSHNNRESQAAHDEDPDPTYWPAVPIKGFFAPGTIEVILSSWGPDAEIKLEVYFSMQDLVQKFDSRVLRPHDVIYVPYNAIGNVTPRYFRISNFTPSGNFRYVWLYGFCKCVSLPGDIAVTPRGHDGQPQQIADYQDY